MTRPEGRGRSHRAGRHARRGRSRHGFGTAALLALGLVTAGCGTSEVAAPAGPASAAPTPSSATTASASAGTGSWTAEGDSFGVDRARWPTTVAAAAPLLRRMPQTFRGRSRDVVVEPTATKEDGGGGASASAYYGDEMGLTIAEAYTTTDTENGKPDVMTANDLLSASFGLVYGCAEGTYRGTATPHEGGIGPGTEDPPKRVWFSCRIDGAEGDEDYTGHAVGWTSGTTAWQVLGPDAETVRALVTLVHDAGR